LGRIFEGKLLKEEVLQKAQDNIENYIQNQRKKAPNTISFLKFQSFRYMRSSVWSASEQAIVSIRTPKYAIRTQLQKKVFVQRPKADLFLNFWELK